MRIKDVVMLGVWLACAAAPAQTFRVLDVRMGVWAGRAVDSLRVWLDEQDLGLYLDDGALLRLRIRATRRGLQAPAGGADLGGVGRMAAFLHRMVLGRECIKPC